MLVPRRDREEAPGHQSRTSYNGYDFDDCFMCYGAGKVGESTKGNTCENCGGRGTQSGYE